MWARILIILLLAYPALRGFPLLSHYLAGKELPVLSRLAGMINLTNDAVRAIFPGHLTGIVWFYCVYLFLVADMYPNRGFGDPKMDTSEGKSLWAELIFCVALFGLSLRVSMSRSRRADLYRKLDEVGYFGFAIVMGLLVGINIANFALVTRLFPAGRLLSPPRQFVSVFDWLLFYFWQFLHTIPDFEVTEVMHWAIPLNYTDRRIGLVVLVFKAFVILPILTTAVGYWNFRQARVSESVRRGLLEVILDRALNGSPRKRRQREDGVLGRAKRRYVRRNAAESADPTLPAEGGSPGEGTG